MRTIFITLLSVLFIGCENKVDHSTFDWLLGNWERTNDDKGFQTYENWSKIKDEEYIGLGYTLKERDTVFKENIRLRSINGNWFYEVTGVNEKLTSFKVIKQSPYGFTAENKMNEFPKNIRYVYENSELNATIYSEDRRVKFTFKSLP